MHKIGKKPAMKFWYKKWHSKKGANAEPIDQVAEDAQYLTEESQQIMVN